MTKNRELILLTFALGATALLALAASTPSLTASANTQEQQSIALNENQTTAAEDGTTVSVGGGNLTVSYNQFYPQALNITAGESVTFVNPTPELHSVVFDFSNGTVISDINLPFTVTGNPELELQQPYNLGEPMLETDENGTQTLITLNKIAFTPSTVDKSGNANYLNGTDVSVTATGNEDVISSGIMMPTDEELEAMFMAAFPEEMMAEDTAQNATSTESTEEEPYVPVIQGVNKFTVAFEEAGTYEFFCPFHPAMYGSVTVS
jgi:plastocyanin